MYRLSNITIGADPELFLVDTSCDKIISSIGIIPGEKGKAYQGTMPEGFGLQIDNILAEFNVPPVPLECKDAFIDNIEYAKKYICDFVKKINPNYNIFCKASAMIDEDQLKSEEALKFG